MFSLYRYSDVITSTIASEITRLFAQPPVQAQMKENIKSSRHWHLWVEFTEDWWIPRSKGQ